MDKMKNYCQDFLGRQAVSKLKDVYQLFSLLEERGKLTSTQLELLQELLEFVGNVKMVDKIQQFSEFFQFNWALCIGKFQTNS